MVSTYHSSTPHRLIAHNDPRRKVERRCTRVCFPWLSYTTTHAWNHLSMCRRRRTVPFHVVMRDVLGASALGGNTASSTRNHPGP